MTGPVPGASEDHRRVVAVMLARVWAVVGRGMRGILLTKGEAGTPLPYTLAKTSPTWWLTVTVLSRVEGVTSAEMAAEVDAF